MREAELRQVIMEVYVILEWGLGRRQTEAQPSPQLAARVYRKRWVDKKAADRHVYEVRATLQRVAPGLNEQQAICLVLECHKAIQSDLRILGNGPIPLSLRKYLG